MKKCRRLWGSCLGSLRTCGDFIIKCVAFCLPWGRISVWKAFASWKMRDVWTDRVQMQNDWEEWKPLSYSLEEQESRGKVLCQKVIWIPMIQGLTGVFQFMDYPMLTCIYRRNNLSLLMPRIKVPFPCPIIIVIIYKFRLLRLCI